MESLTHAIFQTVRYFDFVEQPVTAVQVWRNLIIDSRGEAVRWGGSRAPRFSDIRLALATSPLTTWLGNRWGYYFLRGREELVATRLSRHRRAQMKWKLVRRLTRSLALVPFVRLIALSGSVASGNARIASDLDLFIVAQAGRIWTARLGLLLVSQLLGYRRKYGEGQAPDKLCLNHYVTTASLLMPLADRNLYTALLYDGLIPLTGRAVLERFRIANRSWLRDYLMSIPAPALPHRLEVRLSRSRRFVAAQLEAVLAEPIFAFIEAWAEVVQRWAMSRHTRRRGTGWPMVLKETGRVVLSDRELAFHPDPKAPGLLARFTQEAGQQLLL